MRNANAASLSYGGEVVEFLRNFAERGLVDVADDERLTDDSVRVVPLESYGDHGQLAQHKVRPYSRLDRVARKFRTRT